VTVAVLPLRRLDVTVEERTLRILDNIEKYERGREERERKQENREKAFQHGMDRVLTEIKTLREEVHHDVRGLQARVSMLEGNDRGPRVPMPSTPPGGYSSGGWDLNLPASKSGNIREEDVRKAWSEKLVQLDDEVRTLRAEKDAAERLRLETAKQAEENRKRLWFYVKIAVAVATPLLPTLGVIAAKVFHL
jgi:hypothetical protein